MSAFPTLIHERVDMARRGENPWAIARMQSGWAVMGDVQVPLGYSLLLPDPVVGQLNDLSGQERALYLDDMARLGDTLLAVTGAARINYEILGNGEPALHAHLFPRFDDEPAEYRIGPVWLYPTEVRAAVPFDPIVHGELRDRIATALGDEG